MMWVVEFDHRSDGGPRLVGPFATVAAGERYVAALAARAMAATGDWDASWSVQPLYVPEAA